MQSRVRSLSRQATQTLAHQPMTDLKGIMSSVKGIMSNLKGAVCNLEGIATPRLASMPVVRAKGKSLQALFLVLQAFCITQGYHLKPATPTRLCATCSAVP